jgi:hypothetical protein
VAPASAATTAVPQPAASSMVKPKPARVEQLTQAAATRR